MKGVPKNQAKVLFAENNFWGRTLAAISSSTGQILLCDTCVAHLSAMHGHELACVDGPFLKTVAMQIPRALAALVHLCRALRSSPIMI